MSVAYMVRCDYREDGGPEHTGPFPNRQEALDWARDRFDRPSRYPYENDAWFVIPIYSRNDRRNQP